MDRRLHLRRFYRILETSSTVTELSVAKYIAMKTLRILEQLLGVYKAQMIKLYFHN